MMTGSYNIKLPIKSNTKPNDDLLLTRQKDLSLITKLEKKGRQKFLNQSIIKINTKKWK